VELVERAAVDFLVERLDAGNVLDAMALGEHLSASARGRDLRDKSRAWSNKNFGLTCMVAEAPFRQLPATEVTALVESDELEAEEEDVFAAVMAWVNEDEVERKGQLVRLLPLVRFPMMSDGALAIDAEPLVVAHPLAYQLMFETNQQFARSVQAAACPRLGPRKGQRLGGAEPPATKLAFTRALEDFYDNSAEGGALLVEKAMADNQAAVCVGHVMRAGRHAAEFTTVKAGSNMFLGLARPDVDLRIRNCFQTTNDMFSLDCSDGRLFNGPMEACGWGGMEDFGAGDVMGLLLDCDAGTLAVKKNDRGLGVAASGLTGKFCWAASLYSSPWIARADAVTVRIAAADAAAEGW
jgi:hypothetical protein